MRTMVTAVAASMARRREGHHRRAGGGQGAVGGAVGAAVGADVGGDVGVIPRMAAGVRSAPVPMDGTTAIDLLQAQGGLFSAAHHGWIVRSFLRVVGSWIPCLSSGRQELLSMAQESRKQVIPQDVSG